MRAICRNYFAQVAVLGLLGLLGSGCETQQTWTIAQAMTPRPADDNAHSTVVMLPPCALPSSEEAAPALGPVWRAASGTLDDPKESYGGVGPLFRNDKPISPRKSSQPAETDLPRELNKVTLPPYRVEPPDVLLINAPRVLPRPTYKIAALDQLTIQAPDDQLSKGAPLNGIYTVGTDRQVDLGPANGHVTVAGLTLEQVTTVISEHLAAMHKLSQSPAVSVTLVPAQAIAGPHPVRSDGTVSLGLFGDVYLTGLTLADAKHAVECQLGQADLDAQVTVDVLDSKSKVVYVIYDNGAAGQQVLALPYNCGETVLDAISRAAQGVPMSSANHRIWVARPVPEKVGSPHIMPVDWEAITESGATRTNYMLMPGDRVYVKTDGPVTFTHRVSQMVAPIQRFFGSAPTP